MLETAARRTLKAVVSEGAGIAQCARRPDGHAGEKVTVPGDRGEDRGMAVFDNQVPPTNLNEVVGRISRARCS